MADRCFYFGCWNEAGHYLFPSIPHDQRDAIEFFKEAPDGERLHLDGSLAPRRLKDGTIVFKAQFKTRRERDLDYSAECPQGHYLCHVLDNGFTAVQWWDRCQGDTRGACNSTILLEGAHTAEEVLAAGRAAFPHVFENLERGGPEDWKPPSNQGRVELVEVKK